MTPRVVRTAAELRDATDAWRAAGARVGLVPTMGALHDGHVSLVTAARAAGAQRLALSLFVNPLQFAPTEDLSRYPRTWDEDLARCEAAGVELVYAPSPESMYPEGFQTHVEVERLAQPFEGRVRPTHFRGVTTVVAKLFGAAGPCIAAFGRKDYQQWRAIERMVRDLDMPVTVLGCPIVREPDGLAMSSRNRYLRGPDRARATAFHAALRAASTAFAAGERDTERLGRLARERLAPACDQLDYVALAGADDLEDLGPTAAERTVMLLAARIGATRMIDNAVLGVECLGTAGR